jgi:hypothetical protein
VAVRLPPPPLQPLPAAALFAPALELVAQPQPELVAAEHPPEQAAEPQPPPLQREVGAKAQRQDAADTSGSDLDTSGSAISVRSLLLDLPAQGGQLLVDGVQPLVLPPLAGVPPPVPGGQLLVGGVPPPQAAGAPRAAGVPQPLVGGGQPLVGGGQPLVGGGQHPELITLDAEQMASAVAAVFAALPAVPAGQSLSIRASWVNFCRLIFTHARPLDPALDEAAAESFAQRHSKKLAKYHVKSDLSKRESGGRVWTYTRK